jgi:hypothetical protein
MTNLHKIGISAFITIILVATTVIFLNQNKNLENNSNASTTKQLELSEKNHN